jgi:PhzF family phenazine biosynthesis protein
MKQAPFYQVDAFTDKIYGGNPAAVCLMPCDLEDSLYQSIAKEMNLSETAFAERLEQPGCFNLRWFTPAREVPLRGHATLATAHVLFEQAGFKDERLIFRTMSGALTSPLFSAPRTP